jgi:hypothetical protein
MKTEIAIVSIVAIVAIVAIACQEPIYVQINQAPPSKPNWLATIGKPIAWLVSVLINLFR